MTEYEYRVIPAPAKPAHGRDAVGASDGFALIFAETLNDMGREGWLYVRTDVVTERHGRWPFRRRTETRELLVFQRPLGLQAGALLLTHRVDPANARPAPVQAAPVQAAAPVQPVILRRPRRPVSVTEAMNEVRARRVSQPEVVERVRSGARRITPTHPHAATIAAAE
jgi:hypothetical protein